jgi:transketolase N-terminal domain/subunit
MFYYFIIDKFRGCMMDTVLKTKANEIRRKTIAMINKARGGHVGSSLSE